jgi:membrane protein
MLSPPNSHSPRAIFADLIGLFREAGALWSSHNAPRLGAALAYYSVLSLAPAIIVAMAICGVAFGPQAVRGEVSREMTNVVGPQSAALVEMLLKSANHPAQGFLATLLGLVTMLVGASGVFVELRETLNYIWDVPIKSTEGFGNLVRERFLSFAMVIGIGLLLIASLAASAVIQAAGSFSETYPAFPTFLAEATNFAVTVLVASFLFAVIYRVIPDAPVDWKDVATGSLVTALLFSIGKLLIGIYLGKAGIGSAYGAAGSLVALLVWIYYSAQIFLFGAEFTHVCALRRSPQAP